MLRRLVLTAMMVAPFFTATGQTNEWDVSLGLRGLLITSSKIFPNPNSPSFDLRTVSTPFTSVLGGGLEVRVQPFGAGYYFYASAEYLSQVRSEQRLDGSVNPPRRVPVEEGYRMIPLEVGGSVFVPLGSPTWKLSMGGGFGVYLTDRIYSIAGVASVPVGNQLGFGIHVSIVAEYVVLPGVSVMTGLKFRDPEVDVRNRFAVQSTVYNNTTVAFPPGDIPSRINVDGMTLSAGVRVEVF